MYAVLAEYTSFVIWTFQAYFVINWNATIAIFTVLHIIPKYYFVLKYALMQFFSRKISFSFSESVVFLKCTATDSN